jgi:hypothetical protein
MSAVHTPLNRKRSASPEASGDENAMTGTIVLDLRSAQRRGERELKRPRSSLSPYEAWRLKAVGEVGVAGHRMANKHLGWASPRLQMSLGTGYVVLVQIIVPAGVSSPRVGKYDIYTFDQAVAFIREQLCLPAIACIPATTSVSHGRIFHVTLPAECDLRSRSIVGGLIKFSPQVGVVIRVPSGEPFRDLDVIIRHVPFNIPSDIEVAAALAKDLEGLVTLGSVRRQQIGGVFSGGLHVRLEVKAHKLFADSPLYGDHINGYFLWEGLRLNYVSLAVCHSCGEENHFARTCPWTKQLEESDRQVRTLIGDAAEIMNAQHDQVSDGKERKQARSAAKNKGKAREDGPVAGGSKGKGKQ